MKPDELDALCQGWPGVTVDTKWGADRVYSVGGRMFAVIGTEGADAGRLSFKVPDELFLALTEQPGIVPAPYLARARWVLVKPPARPDRAWLQAQIRRSYELVRDKLPKKAREALR